MKYSVIIPTYNRSRFLLNCLSGIGRQSVARDLYEVIVVDDGSEFSHSENIEKEIPSYNVDIKYFRQENSGPASARNLGWKAASGDYIIFIDDDCVPSENWLSDYIDAVQTHPSGYAYGGDIIGTGEDYIPLYIEHKNFLKHKDTPSFSNLVTANCMYAKKDLIKMAALTRGLLGLGGRS